MEFEWDREKAARNLRRHKVSFYEAATVFADELSITVPDPDHSIGVSSVFYFGPLWQSILAHPM